MKLLFETETKLELILEPWGHVEPLEAGQKITLEYKEMVDTEGTDIWPLVTSQEDGSILIDLPSTSLRGYVNERLFYDCWD